MVKIIDFLTEKKPNVEKLWIEVNLYLNKII